MEAVAGISARIMQIQSQLAQLTPRTPSVAPASAPAAGTRPTPGGTGADVRMSFDAALSQAVSANRTAVTGTGMAFAGRASDVVGSGRSGLGADGIPAELRRHGNGRIPADALSTVAGTRHSLWTPAARSLEALRAAAARDGVTIGVTDSYRTLASQVDLVERKGLYSQGGLAAVPGTSKHGWGMAADLDLDSRAQAWMRANAGRFGFVEDTPREPWHWGYHPTH